MDDKLDNPPSDKYADLARILMQNANKNFVQRIMLPGHFPEMDEGNGMVATHKMADGDIGGVPAAYPTIIFDGEKLIDLGDSAADYAEKTGEYIKFDSPQRANWFATNYKEFWK